MEAINHVWREYCVARNWEYAVSGNGKFWTSECGGYVVSLIDTWNAASAPSEADAKLVCDRCNIGIRRCHDSGNPMQL